MDERQEIASALGIDISIYDKHIHDKNIIGTFYVGDNRAYLIENIKNKIVVNEDNSHIFTKYNLKFEKCSFDKFDLSDRENIQWIDFDTCYFDEINIKNISCDKMYFSDCTIISLVLKDSKFSDSFTFMGHTIGLVKLFNCTFGKICHLSANKINEIISQEGFTPSKNIIEGAIFIRSIEAIEKSYLTYTIFTNAFRFCKNTFKQLDVSHSIFEDNVDFSGCTFGAEVDVEKTIDLSSITFNGNAKFDESKFNHFVAFHTTSFEKTASFYKCEFNTIPNFSPADFKGILNINNVVWGEKNKGFDFKNVKELVEKAYNSNDTMENVINLRSSFSGMKHKLIEQDNLLDAQNFHKAELYCKEIELKKEKSRSTKKWVEWALLLLYRKISDHHTDLNKILHIMLMVIVSYGVMIVMSEYVFYCTGHVFASFLLACLCFGLSIAILYSLYQVKKCCINWITRAIIYTGIVAILICWPNILNPVLGMSNSSEYKNTRVMKVIDKLTAAELNQVNTELMAWRHIQANIAKSTREQILENKNIIKKNKYLTPALPDIVTAIKQDEVIYATRQSMSVIYIVLLVLCLYSLQKTARKNTIVPS